MESTQGQKKEAVNKSLTGGQESTLAGGRVVLLSGQRRDQARHAPSGGGEQRKYYVYVSRPARGNGGEWIDVVGLECWTVVERWLREAASLGQKPGAAGLSLAAELVI